MGDLLSEIQAATTVLNRCTLGKLLDSLPEDDRSDLLEAFGDAGIATTTITRVLRNRGHEVSENTLGDHRKGRCRCA